MKITAGITNGYSAALIRASRILRLSGQSLALFLTDEASVNPCLQFIPPPGFCPLPPEAENVRDNLRAALAENATLLHPLVAFLIENINDDGLLDWDEKMETLLAAQHGHTKLEEALQCLQSLAAPGIGARNYNECLLLQLDAKPQTPAAAAARNIADNYLCWFLRKRLDKLPRHRLAEAAALLETLTLRPGAPLSNNNAAPLLADVDFFQERGLWKTRRGAGDCSPRATGGGTPTEYLRARQIVSAVTARRRQLLRLGQFAANRQHAFLSGAAPVPVPWSMSEAAATLSVSSGMVSHIVTEKIFCAPAGIYALKSLFARKTSSGQSIAAVQQEIKNIVACENLAHPHTDEQLRTLLRTRGTLLARRTVSKYRATAGILRPSLRKRLSIAKF